MALGEPQAERAFYEVPSNASARAHLEYITSVAHIAGTPGDHQMAKYVQAQMASYGLESAIEPVNVSLNYPVSRSLELIDGAVVSWTVLAVFKYYPCAL